MIHGLIVINKEKNISSHSVVEKVRKVLKIRKVGHFGTLDPLAEGVLLIGVGNATKFFNFYIKKKKLYSGKIKFGYATTTYDKEGSPVSEKKEIDLKSEDIDSLLSEFTGEILQKPPIYSAKKFKGKPLYKYARENTDVEIEPIKIKIFSLKGNVVSNDTLEFETLTSSGAYIRSLAHDIGQKVGVGAYLEELKRVKSGEFDLNSAITLEELIKNVKTSHISKVIIPIEVLLPEFPKIIVNQGGRKAVLNGMSLMVQDIVKILSGESMTNFRLFDESGKLLAIAHKEKKQKRFKPFIVFPDR